MRDNLVSVFARGNQELFHSAFLAWLLTPTASHGLGARFLHAVLERLPPSYSEGLSEEYEVGTEVRDGRSRFDILVRPLKSVPGKKGLVFENKVKSFGSHLQLDGYQDLGYNVAVFALLPEMLDRETLDKYPVIKYEAVRKIIASMPLDEHKGYEFFVLQYAEFLDRTLNPFDLLRKFARGDLRTDVLLQELAAAVRDADFSDNDVRTFNYFYYYNFAEYLKDKAPDLWFGEVGYQDGKEQQTNTTWLYEKNMLGPPFMEVILYSPLDPNGCWTMPPAFAALYEKKPFPIAPRLEVRLNPRQLVEAQDRAVGQIMLGTSSDDLKKMLREIEPYRSQLKRCGLRNFHREEIHLHELPFDRLAERLRGMLGLLFLRRT